MADEISVGTQVQIPPGPGRPHVVVATVTRIDGERVWVERFGTKKIEGPFAKSELKIEPPSGPIRVLFP